MIERCLDPLDGLHECPWCACGPSPDSTGFECAHEVICALLREERDTTVARLAKDGKAARSWHGRMSRGPDRRLLSPCTPGDVAACAALTWACRLESTSSGDRTVAVTSVAIGLLIVYLVVTLLARIP